MRRPGLDCRSRCALAALAIVAAALAGAGPRPAAAAAPEIRGTWITTTGNDDWQSANVTTTMTSLKRAGLNTVYVEAFKNGYTNFTSSTLAAFTGSPSLNPSLSGRNFLNETRTAAAGAGLVHGAWFEYGLMSEFGSPSNPLSLKCQNATWTVGTGSTAVSGTGWLLKDSSGAYTNSSNSFVWMNPLVPEVRNLIKGIVVEAINQYDLQIVQFDDHLAWPVQFGWDDYTKAVYKQETNRNLPSNASDSNFLAWRQGKTQAFFAEIAAAAKAAKPSVVVSLAPSIASFSAANYCADWSKWMGSTDEVLPQVYRSTYSAFANQWPAEITASGTNRAELGAGLRLLGTGSSTPWNDLRQQIDQTRTDDALGHSIWYSNGISNSGTNATDNYHAQLTAYYDVATTGIAANPFFQSVRWSGTGGNGGSGTWSQLAAQWRDRSTIWVSSGTGIFDGVGGTVTVSGSVMAEVGLDFRTTGYTVTGGTLALRGVTRADNRVSVAAGATTTFASLLTGSTGLTKAGAGTLVITGTATGLTGGIAIEGGTLRLGNGGTVGSLAAGTQIVVQTGGTLALPTASRPVLSATSLTVDQATGGTIDIGRGRIDIAAGGITEADLRADLIAGRAGGSFSGTSGIMTTGGTAGLATTAVVGYRVFASGSAIVAWAANGDANLDGQVNFTDISLVNNGGKFGQGSSTGATWAQGDFNYSGGVTFTDINLMNNSGLYGTGSYLPVAGLGSLGDGGAFMTGAADGGPLVLATVPEPTGWLVAALGLLVAPILAGRRMRYAPAQRS